MPQQNPCHRCPDRKLGCHDTCKKHLTWKAERRAREERMRQEANARAEIGKIHHNAVVKATRGRG